MGGRRAGALLQQGGCGAGGGRREAQRDPKVLERAVSSGRLPLSCRASSMQDSSLQRKQSDSSREALGEEWSNLQSQAECKPLSPRGGRDCRSLLVLPGSSQQVSAPSRHSSAVAQALCAAPVVSVPPEAAPCALRSQPSQATFSIRQFDVSTVPGQSTQSQFQPHGEHQENQQSCPSNVCCPQRHFGV